MQRVVSRHTALKLNQLFLAGLQPANSALNPKPYGWRSLGCSRNLALQTMESSVKSLIGSSARVLGSLPGGHNVGNGGSTVRISCSSVPRGRPALTRPAFKENRKLVVRRSRQQRSISRIGSSGDFSPQWLLESAVDVLRKFNEKVNNLFQQGGGGDSGSRDFATAAEEKVTTSAENVLREENGALEHEDVLSEQEQGSGFEWRSALWEAEISSVEKLDAGSQREGVISSERTDGDILQQVSVSIFSESAVSEAEKIEEKTSVAISLSPEVLSSENSTVIVAFPAQSSLEIEGREIPPVEQESIADPRSGLVSSLGIEVDTSSQFTFIDVLEVTPPCEAPEVEVRADNRIGDAALREEEIIANQLVEHPENVTLVSNFQQEKPVADLHETVVWSGVSRSGVTGLGADGDISQLGGGSTYPESALIEGTPEIREDETIEEPIAEATSANGHLENTESGNIGITVQVLESAPSAEIEVAVGEALGEADLNIQEDVRFEESATEVITANQELNHPDNAEVGSILTGRNAALEEVKEVDIGELWNRNSSEFSSLAGLEPAALDSTEGGPTLSAEVVEEESDSILGKSDEAGNAREEVEVEWRMTPVDGLLGKDSLTPVSVESGEAVGSSSFRGPTTLAGEAGDVDEVKTGVEESGDPVREEQDTNDAKVASDSSSTDRNTGGMDDLALQHEISRLRGSIRHHAYLYHTLDVPVVSDAAYDSLVKELVHLEAQVSTSESSLNDTVAAPPSPDMLKVIHSVPMLSLASVQKEEDVLLWYGKLQQKLGLDEGLVVEPKVDGLALSLRYEHGYLKWAATRGNGIQGEDVTHNAQRVVGIPLTIPPQIPGTESPLTVLEVRGEIFMSLEDFKELNSSKIRAGEKPFASPRNAAAGSMRLLSSNSSEFRPLSFTAYSIAVIEVGSEPTGGGSEKSSLIPTNQWDVLQFLKSAGFPVNEDNRLFESFDSALEYAKRWKSMRKNLAYEADGVVLKVNDLGIQASLGSTGTYPRWALAWKFAATEVVSVLEGIELTIGRSGAMIPNARLKPVELGGVVISRASLHNFGHVKALGLCEGDHVVVQRAGDVIPQVVQVLEDLRPETATPWVPPEECPTCGSTLTEASASPMVFCSNSTCPSRHSRQVGHFAKTLISGLGSATLSRLEEELVKDPADFYHLDEKALSKVKGFGKQSIKRLLKSIEESKHQDLWLFIAALGIPKVGTNTAKELARKFGSLEALVESDVSGLMDVPGIGAATASFIFDWCHSESNIELVNNLKLAGCKVGETQVTEILRTDDSTEESSINSASPALTDESSGEPDVVEEDLKEDTKTAVTAEDHDPLENVIEAGDIVETPGVLEKNELVEDVTLQPTLPKLSGKSVVITGDFGTIKREDMRKIVTLHGGVVRTSVTSRTSFVLCGNRPGRVKVAEASRRGVEMIDLQDFLSLIGQKLSDIL